MLHTYYIVYFSIPSRVSYVPISKSKVNILPHLLHSAFVDTGLVRLRASASWHKGTRQTIALENGGKVLDLYGINALPHQPFLDNLITCCSFAPFIISP